MPSRNVIKSYVKGGVYHIYNRGVEKRTIFENDQDYSVFLKYLKEYLEPPKEPSEYSKTFTLKGSTFKGVPRMPNNYENKIDLLVYCLMPNHFHLLVRQKDTASIKDFMRSLLTRYSMYFNKRYERVGPLFQGIYKAVLIDDDNYLLHLSRYIHLNPRETSMDILNAYSSYPEYLRGRHTGWIKPDLILSYFETGTAKEFKKFNSYKDFVEKYAADSSEILGPMVLE